MNIFRYTLIGDGSSDRCLVWVINWALNFLPQISELGFSAQIADLRTLQQPPRGLPQRIQAALKQYPCDVLFVHHDAERDPHQQKVDEVVAAAREVAVPYYVPVVPVRMTEAWLLLEIDAIRTAADNPNGGNRLAMPRVTALENIPDPKTLLYDLLIEASEKTGRRREQFKQDLPFRRQRVAELIKDFSPLRQLPAFQAFESELKRVTAQWLGRQT